MHAAGPCNSAMHTRSGGLVCAPALQEWAASYTTNLDLSWFSAEQLAAAEALASEMEREGGCGVL